MPDFAIVDSHVHLFDLRVLPYKWIEQAEGIAKTSLLPEFDAAAGAVVVDKLVFVEAYVSDGRFHEEAAFGQALADGDQRVRGLVAHAPLEAGMAVEEDIAKLLANQSLRGVRRLIEVEHDPSFCLRPKFLEGLRLLSKYDLPFDICTKHWGLSYALELARRCPDARFVLDHIGKPDIRNGMTQPWADQIRELAKLSNVVCKISGVITEADPRIWTSEQVIPYIAHVIEQFGFDRIMYGSDWPVSSMTHEYQDFVAILDAILRGSTRSELVKFYRENAVRTYRLD